MALSNRPPAAVAVLFVASAAPPGALDLKSAIHFALEHSPTLEVARQTLVLRENDYKNTRAALLPSADITTANGVTGTSRNPAPPPYAPWNSNFSFQVSENLYDNGATLTNLSIADRNRQLADVNFRQARDQLSLTVAQQFYTFSLNTYLFEARKQQQALLEKQFRILTQEYEQGLKKKQDYVRFEAQVQRGEIDLQSSKNAIETSRTDLRKTLGVGLDREIAATIDFKVAAPDDVDKTVQRMPSDVPLLKGTFEARQAGIQRGINEESVDLTRRQYYPQVFVAGGVGYQNSQYLGTQAPAQGAWTWDATLTLKYNLWDWGARKRNVESAEINRDIQGHQIDVGLLGVEVAIQQLMATLGTDARIDKLNRELLRLEETSYKYVEADYRNGKLTYLDLETALNDLLDARVRSYSSIYALAQDLAQYRYYEGSLYDTLAE